MTAPMHPLDRRKAAAAATLARFAGQRFAFGKADCVKMATFHLRQLGYRPKLARVGAYSSAASARAALKRAGYTSIGAALDDLGLIRIPPARVLVGDIVQGDSGDVFGALGVYLGNGAMLGWHESRPEAGTLRRVALETAWSAL